MESIDRLRRYVSVSTGRWAGSAIDSLIDQVEREVERERAAAYDAGYDAGFVDDDYDADGTTAQHDAAMAERGWVRLPVDAEGKPIRIGDVMEWPDCSTAEVVGIGDGTFFYIEDGEDAAEWSCAGDKIHHHAPTVEDVLREFVARTQMLGCVEDEYALVAEYATKLRLAGDE